METIRVGQLIERLSKLDKHDKVYCGGGPVADGPEPVAHSGKVDLDPACTAVVASLRDEIDVQNQVVEDLETKIASLKKAISEAIENIDAGETFEATYVLTKLVKE